MANAFNNPTLNERMFSRSGEGYMTLDGTINKSILFFLIVVATSFYSASMIMNSPELGMILSIVGAIGGLILALITSFKKEWAAVTGTLYCAFEGLFLGAISLLFETMFPGIVLQAIGLTFGVMLLMLFLYKSGVIRVTEKFRIAIVAAVGGIMLVYVATLILGLFSINIPYIHGSGTVGIIFSLVVVGVAAMSLVLDFDFIKNQSGRASKNMEWFAAFGLMVTLVWLYFELLKLLSKLRSRD